MMMHMPPTSPNKVLLLPTISTPADLKRLSLAQLPDLAQEIREQIFSAVMANGGHLASNLGVVELTMALHYVYDFGPHPVGPDRLLFDVGHQSYTHKMLTGRAQGFDRLRKKGSVSGFPDPRESDFDLFAVGHAGTAISTAVGMARADAALGGKRKNHVVALVGDASIVNGMAFEGLNGAGTLKRQMLIVLNDNGMSISQPQGAFSEYLERVRVSTTYEEFKRLSEKFVHSLPEGISHRVEAVWDAVCGGLKGALWAGQMFESLGIKYMGPIDGHDLPGLINMLGEIKHVDKPVLLHVKTRKGQGYEVAAKEPTRFHSPASFSIDGDPDTVGCRVEINKGAGKSWTSAFADALTELADRDPRVWGLTAAMPDGTGLSKFELKHKGRFIDTGICESHLVGMAAGMAKSGLRPFAAVYSTFMQRAFDQVWQEVILNGMPVAFCMDRAGFVGDDGAVHHGFMDLAFMRPMPGIVLAAPSDEPELKRALAFQLSLNTASAIRYPRDNVPAIPFEDRIATNLQGAAKADWQLGVSRTLRAGVDATLVVYGALADVVMEAAEELSQQGHSVGVVDARFCKPLDEAMLRRAFSLGGPVITVEDHAISCGFGAAVAEWCVSQSIDTRQLLCLGMPERLVAHATRKEQLAEIGLDVGGIVESAAAAIRGKVTSTAATTTGAVSPHK